MRRALNVEVEVQRKKGRPNRIWKKLVDEESVNDGLSEGRSTLRIKVECWH